MRRRRIPHCAASTPQEFACPRLVPLSFLPPSRSRRALSCRRRRVRPARRAAARRRAPHRSALRRARRRGAWRVDKSATGLARRDRDGSFGRAVDLARALEDESPSVELVVVDGAARSVEAVKAQQADVGFFAIDPLRADGIRFTAPYVLIEGAYLVRNGSPLTDNGQVDRAGTRIVVARGSAYDLYLSREIKSAELVRTTTSGAVVDAFLAQNADVAAGVKQQLEATRARRGVRLLPGRFMASSSDGVPAARGDAAAAAIAEFVVATPRQRLRRRGAQAAPHRGRCRPAGGATLTRPGPPLRRFLEPRSMPSGGRSVDHSIRAGQQRARDDQAERPGSLQVDDKLEPGRLFPGKFAGFVPWRILSTYVAARRY